MYTSSEENYLKALFNLSTHTGEVNVQELSKTLGIKMSSVTSMAKKLTEKKLLTYLVYKPLKLTAKGKKEAGLIIRKHRLTEMYLVQKMGFGWEQVHQIAEQIEHLQSPLFFEKMDELLGYPTVDPHGSPIPDKNGEVNWVAYKKLSEIDANTTITLAAVTNATDEFLTFLNSKNLCLGLQVKVEEKLGFDGNMVVSYGKQKATLGKLVTDKLLVK
jgi:DtxR family transcriptional regulator, Mn-dependent transcriptional regulator